jgi:hypothetical protein
LTYGDYCVTKLYEPRNLQKGTKTMSNQYTDKDAVLAEMKEADRTALKAEIKAELIEEAEIESKNNFENTAWASLVFGIFSIPMVFFYQTNTSYNKPSGFGDTAGNVVIAYVESAAFFAVLGFGVNTLR